MLEAGTTREDIRGVIIQGDARVTTDPEETRTLARAAARWRGVAEADLPEQASPGAAYIRVTPKRYISWDYGGR